jgi:hypothetical protein
MTRGGGTSIYAPELHDAVTEEGADDEADEVTAVTSLQIYTH